MNLAATFQRVGRSRWLPVAVLLVVCFGVTVAIHPVSASPLGDKLAEVVASILLGIVAFFGKLLMVLINIMVQIASFNNFTKAAAVQQGWEVARDLCNLLLVLVLLFIAWGTVLRVESYHYRRMLPKFILMAILINFSKSIAGFLIDISQVIMMSFINVIKDEVYNKLTTGVGLKSILEFDLNIKGANFIEVSGALWLALILLALMAGAVLMLIFILLGRIIVLWILVVLSPVAYLGETIGVLKKAATTWWKMFGDYLVVGPLVAFFLWMAMLVIGTSPSSAGQQLAPKGTGSTALVNTPTSDKNESAGKFTASISKISSSDNLLSFIVAVGMLYAASMAAQQIKTFGGGMGVAAFNKAGGVASKIARSPLKLGGAAAGGFNRWQKTKSGIDLNPVTNFQNVKKGFALRKKNQEDAGNLAAEKRAGQGGLLGLMANSAPSWASKYIGAGLRTTFGRVRHGSESVAGRDKKFDKKRNKEIDQKNAEIDALNQQEGAILPLPDEKGRQKRIELKEQIAKKQVELEELGKTTRPKTTGEVRYRPNDRGYQLLQQSMVREAGKNLPDTADELVEHRDAAAAMGKSGAAEAMAANEKLMQLGRDDLVLGKSPDIVTAIRELGMKLGMSDQDALHHAGNVAAIGVSKGKLDYLDVVTYENNKLVPQDKDTHNKTVADAIQKNPSRSFTTGETSGMTNKELSDPSNPNSRMVEVLSQAGIASLLNGAIKPLEKVIQSGKLSPKYGFLGFEKNIQILKEIKKLLDSQGRGEEAMSMGKIIAHAGTIPSTPDMSRTDKALADAKNIKGSVPPNP